MELSVRERFVIVAGSPRSGTSLLRTILKGTDALRVHVTEPHYVLELYERYGQTITDVSGAVDVLVSHDKYPRADVEPSALREAIGVRAHIALSDLLRTLYRLLNRSTPDRPVVLKHPAFILHLDLIKQLFPDLAVIHCIRDPRANVLSQRTRWPSTTVWRAATKWRDCVRAGRLWRQRGGSPYLEVRYEDLVTTPQAACATMCEFLGIPFEPSMLGVDHVEREWNPTNPGEGSKRRYDGFEQQRIEKWKKYLTPIEVKLIEDSCRREMRWFGYEPTNPRVEMTKYLPLYLDARKKALRKSIRRMRARLAVGVS